MPRKSVKKTKTEGVADPLAAQDEDHQPLDAGEVSGGGCGLMCHDHDVFMMAPVDLLFITCVNFLAMTS